MVDKKADILAVAKAARVSASTVSRSFNHPELVKATTRRKIDNAVRRLGYIRNRAAQTIHGIRSGTIGLVVPTIDHTIFAEVIQSFSDGVDERGFTILLATHGYDLEREYAVVRKMLEHRVDGLALIGLNHADETFALIERQEVPGLLLWNHAEDAPLPCVGSDNLAAGQMIAEHALDLGHRNIALMFPPVLGNDRAQARLAGVTERLAQSGVTVPPYWMIETPYSIADARRAGEALLAQAERPTLVLCGNDVLATGMIYAARGSGLDVPRDMSITGIGDFKGSRDMDPALTTVRLPARKIGAIGAETIARAITEPDYSALSWNCPPELIVRATSKGNK